MTAVVPSLKLPKLGPLGASFSDDVVLAPAPGDPNPAMLRGPTAFGDDVPTGRRVAVRVRLTQEGDTLVFDYRDSDPAPDRIPALSLTEAQARAATLAAINRVLDRAYDDPQMDRAFEMDSAAETWVGAASADRPDDDPATRMGMSRVFDAALGAMANAWPSRVGAGSNSLGAIVDVFAGQDRIRDFVPGGEGATPQRNGIAAWAGPFAPPMASPPPWLVVTDAARARSGGIGARLGGDGLVRTYTATRDVDLAVAIDRITNPPHGLDRAGPPEPAELWLTRPGSVAQRISPWIRHALPVGGSLVVKTAGGAGHGFPGWGVDWDPDAFASGR